jgi:transcriptional regulator with XRE-family HTH domain
MFGVMVKQVRESRGMSQAELAEVSGVDQPNISAIENDRRSPSAETLNRLLVACGYELTAIAGERRVYAPLPAVGWFPDEDLPPALPDDPADEPPTVRPDTSMAERARIVTAVLDAVSRP